MDPVTFEWLETGASVPGPKDLVKYRVFSPRFGLAYQQAVIEFQGTQIQVVMEKLGRKRLLLNDNQRRRVAVKCGPKADGSRSTCFL